MSRVRFLRADAGGLRRWTVIHSPLGELVLTGEQKYLLRKRNPEASVTPAR